MKDTVRYLSQTQASDIPCGQESWTVHTISSRPLAEGGSSVASLPWPSGPLLTGARQLPWLLKEPPALTDRCWPWSVNTVKPEGSRWVFHTRSSAAYPCKSQILTSWISNGWIVTTVLLEPWVSFLRSLCTLVSSGHTQRAVTKQVPGTCAWRNEAQRRDPSHYCLKEHLVTNTVPQN